MPVAVAVSTHQSTDTPMEVTEGPSTAAQATSPVAVLPAICPTLSEQPAAPFIGPHEAQQHPDRGRLARAVGTQEAVHPALVDDQVQSVQGALLSPPVSIGLDGPGHLDDRHRPNVVQIR